MKLFERNNFKSKKQLRFENDHKRLIHVVKMAYRKHNYGDDSIGWGELSEELYTTLADVIGYEELGQLQNMKYFNNK